jgi:hypothetical protein
VQIIVLRGVLEVVRRSRQGPYFYFLLDFYDQVFEEKKIGRF